MKVQNEQELIDCIANDIKKYRHNKNITNHGIAHVILRSINLASVEPEPLAKNKDSESICEKCHDHVDYLYDGLCYDCYDDEHGM
ncbi:hypothetical protein [Arenibacter algicola]|uniref:Uncharacterized protein n=1 Tax=Arenibacter algicola TaxID=616991 RepID=A0A221V0S8_9FLAO|nr:hypothetical protein [Arenibacter algicola]ASO07133.1 hypothetical protein AREALGSMS7_03723 [Arenibacter algicola]